MGSGRKKTDLDSAHAEESEESEDSEEKEESEEPAEEEEEEEEPEDVSVSQGIVGSNRSFR